MSLITNILYLFFLSPVRSSLQHVDLQCRATLRIYSLYGTYISVGFLVDCGGGGSGT